MILKTFIYHILFLIIRERIDCEGNVVFIDRGGYHNWSSFQSIIEEYYLEHRKPFTGIYFFQEIPEHEPVALFYDVLYDNDVQKRYETPIRISLRGRNQDRVGEVERIVLQEFNYEKAVQCSHPQTKIIKE